MYYYPRIPRTFLPGSFTHKEYDNSCMARVFKPSLTPEPSHTPTRTRSISNARRDTRVRAITRTYDQMSPAKILSSNSCSPTRAQSIVNKTCIFYANLSSKRTGRPSHTSISISLEQYFSRVYFRKLKGTASRDLFQKIQGYIREIVLLNEHNSQISDDWIPVEFQQITTKDKFLSSLRKLQKAGRKQFARELVVYYCVPRESVRKQILSNLIGDIHVKLQNKIAMDFSCDEYCLMTERGRVINDVLKIPFFMREMVFCVKNEMKESFMRYKDTKNHGQNKNPLLSLIKGSFRERVRMGDVEPPEKVRLFEKKIEVETVSLISKRRRLPHEYTRPKPKRDQKHTIINRIKSEFNLSVKDATNFVNEFYKLQLLNGRYQEIFNRSDQKHDHLILFQNFRQNCISLKGKSQNNVDRIFSSMEIDTSLKTIDLSLYTSFRMVVQCLAESSKILNFLIRFLHLDTEKQLTKSTLTQIFTPTLLQYKIPRSNRVIVDILWLQFKRNNMIEYVGGEELLTVNIFRENFVVDETVYYFLVSLVFCTDDAMDVAYEVLAE